MQFIFSRALQNIKSGTTAALFRQANYKITKSNYTMSFVKNEFKNVNQEQSCLSKQMESLVQQNAALQKRVDLLEGDLRTYSMATNLLSSVGAVLLFVGFFYIKETVANPNNEFPPSEKRPFSK